MGFSSTADWITKVVTNAQVNRFDWNKTTATGPYVAGRWYDMALSGNCPPAIVYGELVSNGAPTNKALGWTLGANWSYVAGFSHASGSTATLSQANLNISNGRIYRVAFTIASNVGTGWTFALGGGTPSAAQTATGTVSVVAGATPATGLVITPATSTNTGVLTNISVIELLGSTPMYDTNPYNSIWTGGNVSTATKHILDARIVS